jgi:hypothetical protein
MECRALSRSGIAFPAIPEKRVRVETGELQVQIVDRLRSAQARAP